MGFGADFCRLLLEVFRPRGPEALLGTAAPQFLPSFLGFSAPSVALFELLTIVDNKDHA